ncbi:MAG: hypothetical protein HYY90_06880 [Candidatus Omnitrophica bacterium]|nr:hypothetical protein [Candidatus Omnitrophota bacterium]MBI3084073.1 hypothetical protein [Candidatus Omnitrophota bacterium]
MPIIDAARREFIAKILADLGKTIFAVGLASYFFEKFPFVLKAALWIVCVIVLISSVLIHPRKETRGQ